MAVTSVASSASSVTLLSVNSNREFATITNTDANALHVILDSVAATTSLYTVKLATDDYFEVPRGYRGEIRGIWAADGSGVALCTEY